MAGALSTGTALARDPDSGTREEHRNEMRQFREKMQEQMKTEDAELDKLEQQISKASGQEKVDAIAAAVTALIEQRKKMHTQLESMRQKWEQRKGGRPESGMTPGGMMESPSPSAPAQ